MIIRDRGFFVIKVVIALRKQGGYASVLSNEIVYWPKFINDEVIKLYVVGKEVVTQAQLTGKLGGIGFDIFFIKEPDYTMMLMSTYGKLVVSENKK